MMHGSFGTLGALTELTFHLVPAKPFVHVEYETHSTLRDYQAAIFRRYESPDVDFMDGMIHAPNRMVLSLGTFVDEAPYTNRYDWTKVYFESTKERAEDYLKTPHYLFRYDHGVTNVHPKSAIGRLLFGRVLDSETALRIAKRLRSLLLNDEHPKVTVDLFIPFSRAEDFMEWYEGAIGHYPLWCVPYKKMHDYEWLSPEFLDRTRDALFLDLAIYGLEQPPGRNYYRELELELDRIHALKTLISYNYYSESEFWRIFNRTTYDTVKARTDPKNRFGGLYEKTCRRGVEP
jgi:hypothetical protein